MNRTDVLDALVNWSAPLGFIEEELGSLEWDSAEQPIRLTRAHLLRSLERYLSGKSSAADLEHWANLLEGRDDLEMDDSVMQTVFWLANPLLEGQISDEAIKQYIDQYCDPGGRSH